MAYVIKSTITDSKTGKQYVGYFKREMRIANEMDTDIENAKRFEFITEARRVRNLRFNNSKRTEIIKIK